jgi:hypothetical protein
MTVAHLQELSWNSSGRTEENHEKSQGSPCPSHNSNRVLPEQKPEVATSVNVLCLKALAHDGKYCGVFRVCIPFRHVFLTPTCHVSWLPWLVINVDVWIWWSGFILQLIQFFGALHKSPINDFNYETRTRSSTSVCLLCSQFPRWLHLTWVSWADCSWLKVKVTLRLTVIQSVSLGIEPHLGLVIRYLLFFDSYGFVSYGAPSLTRGWVCLL